MEWKKLKENPPPIGVKCVIRRFLCQPFLNNPRSKITYIYAVCIFKRPADEFPDIYNKSFLQLKAFGREDNQMDTEGDWKAADSHIEWCELE
jgi:hypothetical protein